MRHTVWYGVGLLLILLSRFCQNLYPKISFQHHAFLFSKIAILGAGWRNDKIVMAKIALISCSKAKEAVKYPDTIKAESLYIRRL